MALLSARPTQPGLSHLEATLKRTGKGGDQPSLLPQAFRACVSPMAGTPLVECMLALLPLFSPDYDHQHICRSLDQLSRSLVGATHSLPCFYPHSKWAAMGPVQVGVRCQAQVHHHGDGPGLLGAAIYYGDL